MQCEGFSIVGGARAQLPHGMWDLLGPGIEPMSPALASRLATIKLPEKSLFMCLLITCLSLEKMALQILCPFFNWVIFLLVSCKSSLYILDISPLSDVRFANMFSNFMGYLFTFLVVSFGVQRF